MTVKSMYTKELGRRVASAARPAQIENIHVITAQNNKWRVVLQGRTRALRISLTKRNAISYAVQVAKQKNLRSVIIHDKMGQVADEIKMAM